MPDPAILFPYFAWRCGDVRLHSTSAAVAMWAALTKGICSVVGISPASSVFIIIRPDGRTELSQSSSHWGEVCLIPQTSNKHVLLITIRTVSLRLLTRLFLLQCSERSRDWCDLFGLGGAGGITLDPVKVSESWELPADWQKGTSPLSCTEVLVHLLPHYCE